MLETAMALGCLIGYTLYGYLLDAFEGMAGFAFIGFIITNLLKRELKK
ncbi:hypothetical protein [Helicobacter sp. 16-1353]|nr:hypothetical protein [Helicobacter sp. 16-1353]